MGHEQSSESVSGSDSPRNPAHSDKNILESRTFKEGAIYLFVRADYKKRTWMCRIKVPNSVGYVYRSTRTTDEHEAFAFANTLYNQTFVRVLNGETANVKKLGPVVESYIKSLELLGSRQSIHNKILLMRRLTPFLRVRSVEGISTAFLSEVFAEAARLSSRERLSPNTIRRVGADLKHFLNWSVEQGHLTAVPKFPKIVADHARRAHFNDADWRRLTRHLREFVKVENKAIRRDRVMLVNYVLILGNTGIRVGEARNLKWQDVREIPGEIEGTVNIVLNVTGKTGPREAVSREVVKTYLKRIYQLRVQELATKDEPSPDPGANSLIFCHRDGSPIASFKKSFQSLIRAAKVETDSHGQKRTIYSLRHTYATFRLHEGVHQFSLAKNMGTSVAMLERYYGHTSNVTSAHELTKTSKKRSTSGKASSLDWLK